jgi:hypothetical protein
METSNRNRGQNKNGFIFKIFRNKEEEDNYKVMSFD